MVLGPTPPLPPPPLLYLSYLLLDYEKDKLYLLVCIIGDNSHSADKYKIASLIGNNMCVVVVKYDRKNESNLIVNSESN